ncbi:DUF5457 domain-containing protein [Alistipes putredinis]|uniref:DUF5457 domain-containing protein n=1 Tax=Alistipes putredinis TaxID=28117 RepID=UPI003A9480E5
MEPTKEQLQAEILEILYQKCLQKPIWVSCTEVFWSISNLKVTERSVKEILDWLVKNDLVIYQADKYQISKREFVDISKRKALEKKATEAGNEAIEYTIPTPTMPSTHHHPWLEPEHRQPAAKPASTMSVIIALIVFLISGTLIGILVFNTFATEKRSNIELAYLPDSIQIQSLQVDTPGYIRDAYTTNRNFKNIQKSLEVQQAINVELTTICKRQQSQINTLTTYVKQQAADIEHLEKERKIYTWMIALALLVLSSLLVCRFWHKI